jgi:hypothetical protein
MLEEINNKVDLHSLFASKILGISYAEFRSRLKKGDKEAKSYRQLTKSLNFGLPGGLGAFQLVRYARANYNASFCELTGQNIVPCRTNKTANASGDTCCSACMAIASDLRAEWFSFFSEVAAGLKLTGKAVKATGRVQVPGPESLGPGLIRGGCSFTSGANLPFQGLAARLATRAWYATIKEMFCDTRSVLFGSRVNVFVHDELISSHRTDVASDCANRISAIMKQYGEEMLPDCTNIVAEPCSMLRWFKGAEHETDASGRLLVIGECPRCVEKRELLLAKGDTKKAAKISTCAPVDVHGNVTIGKSCHNNKEVCDYSGPVSDLDMVQLFGETKC